MSAKNANLVLVERSNSGDAGTAGNGTITVGASDGLGSLISTGQTNGLSNGTMALGCVESAGTIQAQAYGTLALGHATNTAIITTEQDGSVAFGKADGVASGGGPSQISANGIGALSFGDASTGGVIGSIANGAQSNGIASAGGSIQAGGDGSMAFGSSVSGGILPTGLGLSYPFGSVTTAGSKIQASGEGSAAFGQAGSGANVVASNIAALAFGVAYNASISATAQASVAGGYPLAGPVASNGVTAIAFGDALTGNARLSTTLGLGNDNESYGSLMFGKYGNTIGATNGSWVATDPLLVLGNGVSGTPSNAFTIAKDGRVNTTASQIHTSIRLVSGSVTLNARTDRTAICNTLTAAVNVTLPVGEQGLEFFVVDGKNHANTYNVVISTTGTDIFPNGLSSDTVNTDGGLRHYQFIGGVWYILGKL